MDEVGDRWSIEPERALERTHREGLTACWHLASELVRRHPDRLTASHGWANELYDVVGIHDLTKQRTIARFNANGSSAELDMHWPLALRPGQDPRDWLVEFERRAGIPTPAGALPPSTPSALAVRWTATFLKLQAGARAPWITVPEVVPDHYEETPRSSAFAPVAQWVASNIERQALLIHLARGNNERDALVLSPDGDLWRASGEHISLPRLHTSGRPMTELLLRTVPDLLP